ELDTVGLDCVTGALNDGLIGAVVGFSACGGDEGAIDPLVHDVFSIGALGFNIEPGYSPRPEVGAGCPGATEDNVGEADASVVVVVVVGVVTVGVAGAVTIGGVAGVAAIGGEPTCIGCGL